MGPRICILTGLGKRVFDVQGRDLFLTHRLGNNVDGYLQWEGIFQSQRRVERKFRLFFLINHLGFMLVPLTLIARSEHCSPGITPDSCVVSSRRANPGLNSATVLPTP